jgi:bacterioferritin-associated ferredoxin
MVGLGWHVTPDPHLAELAGARFEWSETWSRFLPKVDAEGRMAKGVYLAGDGARVLGADGAEIAGRLAARACLKDLGLPTGPSRRDKLKLARMHRFAKGVSRAFPWPDDHMKTLPDTTVVCRCEGVTARSIREAAQQVGPEINRVKSQCRAGMGRCQGRYCQSATLSVIAAETHKPAEAVGHLRAQPPVRPLPISTLLKGDVKD